MFWMIILPPLICALPCDFSQRWWRFWLFLGLTLSGSNSILWATLLHPKNHLCADAFFAFNFSDAHTVYLLIAGILGIGLMLHVWFTRCEHTHMPRFAAFNMVAYALALITLFAGSVTWFFVLSMLLTLLLAVGMLRWGRSGHAFVAMEWIVYKMIAYTLMWLGLSSVAAQNAVFTSDLMRLSPLLAPDNFSATCLWGALAIELGAFPFLAKSFRAHTLSATSLALLQTLLLPLTSIVVLQRTVQLAAPTWWGPLSLYWLAVHIVGLFLLYVKTQNMRAKFLLLGGSLPTVWLFCPHGISAAYFWLIVSVCAIVGLLFWKRNPSPEEKL